MKRILREPLFYLLPILAILYIVIFPTKMEISDIKITINDKTKNITLPYSTDMRVNEVFLISFNLFVKDIKTAKFHITPDDCIQEILINGEKFSLKGVEGYCDYVKGADFDFSKHVHEGSNYFEFHIKSRGGPGGLQIEEPYNGLKSLNFIDYIFVLLLLFSIFIILRKFKFKFIAAFIILIGIIVRLLLYTYNGPMHNSYDTGGHLHYIQIIAEEKRIPKHDECWSCYHPPLYYASSALIKNIADNYNSNFTNRILQQFNLLLSFVSVVLGVAFILNLLGNSRFAYLASLISALWPGFVIAAPRIGNDSLFYFGTLFCMLFVQKYWRNPKSSNFILASIGASIALAAKANGFIILGVWIMVYILKTASSFKIGSLKVLIASVFIIAFFVGFSNYRTIVNIYDGKGASLVENSNSLNGNLRVNNKFGNYIYFDLEDYIMEPYSSPWTDKGGRQYFWNYALKTSLFGEFKFWNAPAGHIFATILSILVLVIFILALWGIIHVKFNEIPSLLFTVFLFAGLIYLRVSHPYSCSNDFRYVFPVIFPLAYFSVQGMQILQDSRIRIFSYASLLLFATLSFLFILGQAIYT